MYAVLSSFFFFIVYRCVLQNDLFSNVECLLPLISGYDLFRCGEL